MALATLPSGRVGTELEEAGIPGQSRPGLLDPGALVTECCAHLASSRGMCGRLAPKETQLCFSTILDASFSFLCLLTAHLTTFSYNNARFFVFLLGGCLFLIRSMMPLRNILCSSCFLGSCCQSSAHSLIWAVGVCLRDHWNPCPHSCPMAPTPGTDHPLSALAFSALHFSPDPACASGPSPWPC